MPSPPFALHILPGTLLVTFLIAHGTAVSALTVPPAEFLSGLRAATAALGFDELLREEERVDDLLPWAGNV